MCLKAGTPLFHLNPNADTATSGNTQDLNTPVVQTTQLPESLLLVAIKHLFVYQLYDF